MALTEIISDQTRRVFWLASYGIDTKLTPIDGSSTSLFIRSGSVSVNLGPAINWPGGSIIALNPFFGGRIPSGTLAFSFVPNGTHQLYVDGTTGNITMAVSSPGAAFPAGSLPLYVITTDGVNRFQNVSDVRSSTAGMRATNEVVSNNLYRASYGNSFPFSEITAQNSGAYSVQIGDGQISGVSPNNTAGRWMNLTPESSGTSSQNPNTNYPGGSTLQAYVDQTGLQIRQIEYPLGVLNFGVTSITQFPSFFPLFIAHMDAVERVITLDDYRPA